MTPADAPTPEKPSTPSAPPTLKGWGRLRGAGSAPVPTPTPQPPPPKIETVQPMIVAPPAEKKSEKSDHSVPSKSGSSNDPRTPGGPDYQHLNDRLNRIEQLISDLMVKVDDKTRSIEKSVAKVKAKSKHAKPQSVTICVDSPNTGGATQGGSNNDCDEQFL